MIARGLWKTLPSSLPRPPLPRTRLLEHHGREHHKGHHRRLGITTAGPTPFPPHRTESPQEKQLPESRGTTTAAAVVFSGPTA
jgi:hypothetical protein